MARARATMEEFIREKMDLEALQWIKQLNEEKNHKKRLKPSVMGKRNVMDVLEKLLQQVEPKTPQTLELEATRKASLEARKRLINMMKLLEERRQQHYNALVQVEEHLERMEEEMVGMQTSFEDFHGQIAELGGPKDDSHEDDMMEKMKDELVTQVEPRQDTLQALVGKPHGDVANVSMIMEDLMSRWYQDQTHQRH